MTSLTRVVSGSAGRRAVRFGAVEEAWRADARVLPTADVAARADLARVDLKRATYVTCNRENGWK